jgi:photosystem II stability/assembly factor-like uncharacterized protein
MIRPGPKGDTTEMRSWHNDGYTSITTSDLPASSNGVSIKALNDSDALITVGSGQSSSVYATTDGGSRWVKVVPPSRATSGFTVPARQQLSS